MRFGPQGRTPRLLQVLALAAAYLFVVTSIFGFIYFLSGGQLLESSERGFVGHSFAVNAISGFLSFGTMTAAMLAFKERSVIYNVLLGFAVSTAVATADFFGVMAYFRLFGTNPNLDLSVGYNAKDLFVCWIVFMGWTFALLMLRFNLEMRDREGRLAAAREEAMAAQMRALRNQVSPHFLFNTLNSIAGLIEEGASSRAERMTMSLSTFLRTTLMLEPLQDVLLDDELSLHAEYLAVEQERFSERMNHVIDAPTDVRRALVPTLILQPLIENAIKHGVGRSARPTTIRIIARRENNELVIVVENDLPQARGKNPAPGCGIGLANVADRLRLRFGRDGQFTSGFVDDRLFRAEIRMPWCADERQPVHDRLPMPQAAAAPVVR
ncbi:MAG TPA: histidine kinase [Novosphingobium sp.]|nr:histidine kinase [Novosphingobium sp.]